MAERNVRPSAVIVNVDRTKLHQSEDVWKPEVQRLAILITAEILRKYNALPVGTEHLIIEVQGFPGLSEITKLSSSEAMGTAQIRHSLPDAIIQLLKKQGINTESTLDKDFKPRYPSTSLVVRQFIRHGDAYGPDSQRSTYSYQSSVFQFFARRIQ